MTPRIDVHMLTLDEPGAWRQACLDSIRGAPIRLHILPGIRGHVGAARAAGLALGDLPYVSYVDPDDLYDGNALGARADALAREPRAMLAYTDEALLGPQGRIAPVRRSAYSAFLHAHSPLHVHGLICMRRSAVEPLLAAIASVHDMPEWHLTRHLAAMGMVLHVPVVGRLWRQHPAQYHRSIHWRTTCSPNQI